MGCIYFTFYILDKNIIECIGVQPWCAAQPVVLDQHPACLNPPQITATVAAMCIEFRPFQRVSCSYQGADKPISQPLTSMQLLIGPHKGESWPLDFVTLMFATEKGVEKRGNWLRSDCKSCSCRGIKDVALLDLDIPDWVTMQLFALLHCLSSLGASAIFLVTSLTPSLR